MDCADIVIGQARGNRFRVFDYYSRDRATPRRDYFYGGDDDITAAVGKEVNGVTSIIFRRPLSTGWNKTSFHKILTRAMNCICLTLAYMRVHIDCITLLLSCIASYDHDSRVGL